MSLLAPVDYPAVRAAIDTALTADDLPDAVIGLDLYAGAARRAVLARDPDAAGRAGEALARVQAAAQLWCAALLAPAVPQIVSETHGDDTYRRQLRDPALLAAELRARAEEEIAAARGPSAPAPAASPRPALFRTAPGRRGR